jgi:hypothetical protein
MTDVLAGSGSKPDPVPLPGDDRGGPACGLGTPGGVRQEAGHG